MGLWWLSRLSDILPPLRSWVRALYRTFDHTWEEFVNTLPKVGGFPWVRPTGKVDMVAGLGLIVKKIMRKSVNTVYIYIYS